MKLVVLQVEDDALVDRFIKENLEDPSLIPQATIVGVFKAPTKFCECGPGNHKAGFTRGQKYGWWVCAKCKKPTSGWGKNLNAVLSSARNLLAENHTLGAAPMASPTSESVSSPARLGSSTSTSPDPESPGASSVAGGSPVVGVSLSDAAPGDTAEIRLT
jgi:hypothetical protein